MFRVLLVVILACSSLGAIAQAPPSNRPGHYLFVWTADQAKQGNDFLAVIDADPASPSYGKLVASVGTDIKSVPTTTTPISRLSSTCANHSRPR